MKTIQFSYKARDEIGKMVSGVQMAEGEDELFLALKEKNLYLISAKEEKEKEEKKTFTLLNVGSKIKRRDIIDFTDNLATIVSAGIPVLHGIQDLASQRTGTKFSKVINKIAEDVEGGALLYEAFSRQINVFGETYVYMVKAGESSGTVVKVLRELVKAMKWQDDMNAEIKKMSVYPIAVFSAIFVLIILLFSFAFPRIAAVLIGMKVPLPFATRFFIEVSKIFHAWWYIIVLSIFGGVVGLRIISKTQRGKQIIDRLKLKIPIVGDLIWKISLTRFARHLSFLLEAGIGILEAFSIVEKLVGNYVVAEAVRKAREDIESGSTVSDALRRSGVFSPMVIRMVAVGESTGTISVTLMNVSDYYDREVPITVKKLFSIIEPATIVFMAFIVLTVALSIYLPIYKSITLIK